MGKYCICPDCGAHLDHGETCDCNQKEPPSEREPLKAANENHTPIV